MAKPDIRSNDMRYILTDTHKRAASAVIREELADHVAAFLAKGGQIQQVESGICVIGIGPEKDLPFRITNQDLVKKNKDKQAWKDHSALHRKQPG